MPNFFSINTVEKRLVQFLNATWIPDSPTIWMPDKPIPSCFLMYLVQFSNGRSSTLDIAHGPTIWKPNHLKSELQKVWYSNVSGIQMVVQIPTVLFFSQCWNFELQTKTLSLFVCLFKGSSNVYKKLVSSVWPGLYQKIAKFGDKTFKICRTLLKPKAVLKDYKTYIKGIQ